MRVTTSAPVAAASTTQQVAPAAAPVVPPPAPKTERDTFKRATAAKPTAAQRPAPTRSALPTTYRVRPGDTMSGIAVRHDLTLAQLIKRNPQVKNPSLINVGQVLKLTAKAPAPKPAATYTVKSGDTFGEIATRHGLTTPQLARLNPKVEDLNRIYPGQKLNVKAPLASPPQQPPSTPAPTPAPTSGPKARLNAGMPNTEGWPQAKRFALYSDFVNKFGDAQAKKDLAAGKRVVLSLRRDTPMTGDQPYYGKYDDRIVVLWKDRSGPHVTELAANTEPNRRWSIEANNSSKPVGRLADNQTIRYHKTWSSKFNNHLQPYGNPYAQRDADRDYRFEKGEKSYNGDWGGQLMYIHSAYDGNTGSQGCQTMDPGRFASFWRALGTQKDFSNVLVNVTKR
jgi:LysM repeat protein